jgi:predicted sugar kinase
VPTERGARSGIGIATFEQGGLVVDGGRGKQTLTPPVISRMTVPDDWRFILVFDQRGQGQINEYPLLLKQAVLVSLINNISVPLPVVEMVVTL